MARRTTASVKNTENDYERYLRRHASSAVIQLNAPGPFLYIGRYAAIEASRCVYTRVVKIFFFRKRYIIREILRKIARHCVIDTNVPSCNAVEAEDYDAIAMVPVCLHLV